MNYGARCFTAGTLVLCKGSDGEKEYRRIEDVKEGDTVWAYDEATGKYGWKEVVRLFRGETLTTATLRIVPEGVGNGGSVDDNVDEIVCTPNHPFLVLNAGADRKVILTDFWRWNYRRFAKLS
jgi:intein/homing endonuclease